jgi:hypothetical protein
MNPTTPNAHDTVEPTNIAVAMPSPNDRQFAFALSEAAVAGDYIVDSADMAEFAAAQLVEYKRQSEALEARRVAITGPMNVALRNVNALFKPVMDRLDEASRLLRSRLLDFNRKEQQRIAEENAARERAAREAREAIEARAREAANAGRAEEAFALKAGASVLTAPVAPMRAAKVAGVSTRTNWTADCTDLATLVAYVAQHPEYLNLLQANQQAITALAKAQKSALAIPGIRAYDRGGVAIRA